MVVLVLSFTTLKDLVRYSLIRIHPLMIDVVLVVQGVVEFHSCQTGAAKLARIGAAFDAAVRVDTFSLAFFFFFLDIVHTGNPYRDGHHLLVLFRLFLDA